MRSPLFPAVDKGFATFLFISFCFLSHSEAQNIAINNDASVPDPSAILDVKSTTKGMLVPRMSSAQRNAIVSPVKGLLVFDNNTNGFWYYNGSSWINLAYIGSGWGVTGNSSTDSTLNFIGTTDSHSLVFKVNNQNAGVIGFNNTSLGYQSMSSNTTGFENTAIGNQSLVSNSTGADNTAIGYRSLLTSTGSGNTAVGSKAMFFINNGVEGSFNTAIGASASLNFGGSNNLAAGYLALGDNTSGNSNVAIGSNALRLSSNVSNLVAVGDSALFNNISGGIWNTAIGSKALYSNTSGISNTGVGFHVLYANTTGQNNTALGPNALLNNTTGNFNIAVGSGALNSISTSSNNTAVGYTALVLTTSGANNTAVGYGSLLTNESGNNNTAIGYLADISFSNFNNATAIGAQSQANCSNCMVLGSIAGINGATSSVHVGIGVASPTTPLSFAQTLEKKISLYPGATGDAGFGVFGNELRINSDYVGADITFGYDDRTNGFTENMRVRGNGNVGIGTNNPSQKLTVNGNICYTGSIAACSDIRYKENIAPFLDPLSSVMSMNGFYYNWKKDQFPSMNFSDSRQIGFSAQEIEKLFPEIVTTDGNGYKSVDYGRLTPVLVEAIKEQQKEIVDQAEEINSLKKMVQALIQKVNR